MASRRNLTPSPSCRAVDFCGRRHLENKALFVCGVVFLGDDFVGRVLVGGVGGDWTVLLFGVFFRVTYWSSGT